MGGQGLRKDLKKRVMNESLLLYHGVPLYPSRYFVSASLSHQGMNRANKESGSGYQSEQSGHLFTPKRQDSQSM